MFEKTNEISIKIKETYPNKLGDIENIHIESYKHAY